MRKLKRGAIVPNSSPHIGPNTRLARRTTKCMGRNILPATGPKVR